MPDMPGTELLREMKRLRPDLVTVLVSGYGGPDLQAQAEAAGVQAVLAKPLRAAELAECLAGVLRARAGGTSGVKNAAPAAVTREDVS